MADADAHADAHMAALDAGPASSSAAGPSAPYDPPPADALIIEVTGTEEKVDAFIEMVRNFGIKELVRTGRIAMTRGSGPATTVDGKGETEHHRYRPAGEGKAKVGSLL